MLASAARLLLIPLLIGPALGSQKSRIVSTLHGKVQGELSGSGDYHEFLGIRYGVPIKFRAPAEPASYSGVFKADARHVACAQPATSLPFGIPSTNEDCLVLNVFTPTSATNASLPVMVFIHGGGFGSGTSTPSFYGPRFLVSRGVVVVTINYRLNAYGFLNLGIKEAPGNAGLKDQRAALRWVKNNIAGFGGDPGNVTVFGHGAGATSAVYLTLSPTTKGLFNRIIVASGAPFTKNSYDPTPIDTAEMLAKALGSKANTPEELLEVFTKTPVDKVMDVLAAIPDSRDMFAPSLEAVFDDEEPFLIDTPYNILATGLPHPAFNPAPAMIGQTTSETLIDLLDAVAMKERADKIKNGDLSYFLPRSLKLPTTKDASELSSLLKTTYMANRTGSDAAISAAMNFHKDFSYAGPISLFSEMYANSSKLPVYEYVFEHSGDRNVGRRLLQLNATVAGTTHYDDLFYLMELESAPLPAEGDDAQMVGYMTTLWTNFAKFGSPSPLDGESRWLPHPHRLAISPRPRYLPPASPERVAFWRGVYFQYGADIRRA